MQMAENSEPWKPHPHGQMKIITEEMIMPDELKMMLLTDHKISISIRPLRKNQQRADLGPSARALLVLGDADKVEENKDYALTLLVKTPRTLDEMKHRLAQQQQEKNERKKARLDSHDRRQELEQEIAAERRHAKTADQAYWKGKHESEAAHYEWAQWQWTEAYKQGQRDLDQWWQHQSETEASDTVPNYLKSSWQTDEQPSVSGLLRKALEKQQADSDKQNPNTDNKQADSDKQNPNTDNKQPDMDTKPDTLDRGWAWIEDKQKQLGTGGVPPPPTVDPLPWKIGANGNIIAAAVVSQGGQLSSSSDSRNIIAEPPGCATLKLEPVQIKPIDASLFDPISIGSEPTTPTTPQRPWWLGSTESMCFNIHDFFERASS